MKQIQELMHNDMLELDKVIRADLKSNIFLINQISEYIIVSGGKRIRPLLTLLCGRICGFTTGNTLHKMAAMIEYIHTATLLHDDVVDESGMRRGRQTSNAVFGNAASVLVGDFIYTRAFQMMLHGNSLKLMQIMANCTNQVSEGEVLQLLNIGKSNLTENEYFAVIKAKTAALFEAAARVAAIITNSPEEKENSLANYAINLGTAFQIIDDILDYSSSSDIIGKNVGDDLLEGKVTLPLIYLIQNGTDADKKLVMNAIEHPQNAKIESIISLVKKSNALKYCKEMAQNYINNAVLNLSIFEESVYKTAMIELVEKSLNRIN
jgi:octaprenyl-diphosphate synthase